MSNIRPVSAEVEASVLAEYFAFAPMLEANERPASTGVSLRLIEEANAEECYEPVAVGARRQRVKQELEALSAKMRMLNEYGVEPEYLAERFGLSLSRVYEVIGLKEEAEAW